MSKGLIALKNCEPANLTWVVGLQKPPQHGHERRDAHLYQYGIHGMWLDDYPIVKPICGAAWYERSSHEFSYHLEKTGWDWCHACLYRLVTQFSHILEVR